MIEVQDKTTAVICQSHDRQKGNEEMKKKFSVELFYEIEYEIEAENEDEAIEQAVENWKNTFPNVVVRPAEEEGRKDIACGI